MVQPVPSLIDNSNQLKLESQIQNLVSERQFFCSNFGILESPDEVMDSAKSQKHDAIEEIKEFADGVPRPQ